MAPFRSVSRYLSTENISISNSSVPKLPVLKLASMIVCNSETIRRNATRCLLPREHDFRSPDPHSRALLLNYFVLADAMRHPRARGVDAKFRSARPSLSRGAIKYSALSAPVSFSLYRVDACEKMRADIFRYLFQPNDRTFALISTSVIPLEFRPRGTHVER